MDTVIVGEERKIFINPEEASDYKWIEWEALQKDIEKFSNIYSLAQNDCVIHDVWRR